ncbi:hypothetical protein PHYNN_234 [Pantoea phage Phynn]|nr:hypothetical protein PHYNN_234 [Pantoea phage Phynn]
MLTAGNWYYVLNCTNHGGTQKDNDEMVRSGIPALFRVAKCGPYNEQYLVDTGEGTGKLMITLKYDQEWKVRRFAPSGVTKFKPGCFYAAVDTNIIVDVMKHHYRFYGGKTRIINFFRGNGHRNFGSVIGKTGSGGFCSLFGKDYQKGQSFTGPSRNPSTYTNCRFADLRLPDFFSRLFVEVEPNPKFAKFVKGAPAWLPVEPESGDQTDELEMIVASPEQKEVVEVAEQSQAENSIKQMNTRHGLAVTPEDMELLNAVKFLLEAKDVWCGKRTRLCYMEETYSRESFKTASDIIKIADQRRKEIVDYREENINKISRIQQTLQEIDHL